MSTNLDKLLVLQDRDRKIMRFTREIEDLPERKKAIETQLDAHQRAVEEAEDVIRKNTLRQKEQEALIAEKHERIRKLREQQISVKTNEDYRNLEKQIYQVEQDILQTEDQQLVLMEQMEAANKVKREKSSALQEERKAVDAELNHLQQRIETIEADLVATKKERAELAQDIDPEWVARFERVLKHRGDYAVVPIENGTCGGCHMKLPPQVAHDARRLDDMTSCMYCGRMLYYMP